MAGPDDNGRWPSSAWASWARRWPANLARAGIEVVAYNRTREKAERLAGEHDGVSVADAPAQAAAAAGAAISMVPDVPEVEEVLLGADGAGEGLGEGGLAIDMSTIAPSASRSIGGRLDGAGRRLPRRAGDRLAAQGRGRHADDHGRRRPRTPSSAPARCSRPWAS